MERRIFTTKEEAGREAAGLAADAIRGALRERGEASLIAATGTSQFELLEALADQPRVDWSKTTFFHLDEYVGLPETHPASFRKYLKERIVTPLQPGEFVFIHGDAPDPDAECRRLGELIAHHTIDVALVGIGENGHLAFNDPPADFETEEPYIVVDLDDVCRGQQFHEGWFSSFENVPRQAISMSIRQVLKSAKILCVVSEKRKAEAVRDCMEGEVSPQLPASVLREHEDSILLLDKDAAALLTLPA